MYDVSSGIDTSSICVINSLVDVDVTRGTLVSDSLRRITSPVVGINSTAADSNSNPITNSSTSVLSRVTSRIVTSSGVGGISAIIVLSVVPDGTGEIEIISILILTS